MYLHVRKYILLYTLIPLFLLFVCTSYFRFVIMHDYLVSYEGVCDPVEQSCFVGCEDDECTQEYYYTLIQKHARNIYAQCGADITNCEAANVCLAEDKENCSITYCDPQTDGESCEVITSSDTI